jgi:hypothetical protein
MDYDERAMRDSVKAHAPEKLVRFPEAPAGTLDGSVSTYRAQIRECLENEDFEGARDILATALREHAEEPELRRLERALAPPKIHATSELDQDRTQELRWLERAENVESYQGKWIALLGLRSSRAQIP